MMTIFKQMIEAFLLPPGIIILLIVVIGASQFFHKRWLLSSSMILLGLIAWAISTSPVSDIFLEHLESNFRQLSRPSGDVIVVLGAGISTSKPKIFGKGAPSQTTAYRLIMAARLHDELHLPVIYTGAGKHADSSAAKNIVTRFLNRLGVNESYIIAETQSKTTKENAVNVARLCRLKGFNEPIIVSSAYHLKRAVYCFKQEGLKCTAVPADFETWEGKQYTLRSFLPGHFQRFSTAMKEIMGLLVYRLAD